MHRADTDEQFAEKLRDALYFACNGGVVVSAFISPREKMVRQEVEAAGGKIILLRHKAYAEKEKPAHHDFELCCDGRLLILTPAGYDEPDNSDHPSRRQCLDMNNIAEAMALQN